MDSRPNANLKGSSREDSVDYWKQLCQLLRDEKNELLSEFDEFQNASKQLEKELEVSINELEKTNRKLQRNQETLQNENESLKTKLEDSHRDVSALQLDLKNVNEEKNKMSKYIRELEQKNDDLERTERMIMESVAVKESLLNNAIEKNALLELEVDEKESLQEKLQRLMDETNELKQELNVKDRPPVEMSMNGSNSDSENNNTLHKKKDSDCDCGIPLDTSNRFLAINILSDLIKKIGSLRSKISKSKRQKRHNSLLESSSHKSNCKFLESKLNGYRQSSKDGRESRTPSVLKFSKNQNSLKSIPK